MDTEAIEIRDREGNVKLSVRPNAYTGELPSWNEIFLELSIRTGSHLRDYDFSSAIRERVALSNIVFEDCILDFEDLKRSTLTGCVFRNVTIRQTSFHHLADRSDRTNSQGTLFQDCVFEDVVFFRCDFVMSKFFGCQFSRCQVTECDMRNVFWFDRFATRARTWEALPRFPDPFKTCELRKTRFGHPVGNMFGVPVQMMIPESYTSIWDHLGLVQRRMLKLAYTLREESHDAFRSSI
ncbi:pentapeptide repeat-containing protein [Salipiger mucosus]|uniref:Pentapeptide repeat-containing protein n=1 Tax=Salipiger mucosus DSM 16094 TaxID=1123237 RepID=S9S191_9RHOB|nr:pentapeptide repeat-containing protein [Salipiger mucosus]EPX83980.1 hypothetical protein Salmuc_01755 [Salipiger mucosus DSM 16094]